MKKYGTVIIALWVSMISVQAQDMFVPRCLTPDNARQGFPSWSPDGDSIVFQTSNRSDTMHKNGLWIFAADGTGARQIFHGVAEHPQWSPDGRYIIYDADTGTNIKMIPYAGGDPISFLPDTIHIEKGGLPCWSPDATQIAFIEGSTRTLCVYSFATGTCTNILNKDGIVPLPGCWTEDRNYIITAFMEIPSRRSTIWKISSDGKQRIRIEGHHENFYRHIALSPDGSLLVYAALQDKYLGLFVMPAEGGRSLPLAVSPKGHDEGPSWSPDGKRIAFSSSRSGYGNIWIMDLDIEAIKEKLKSQD